LEWTSVVFFFSCRNAAVLTWPVQEEDIVTDTHRRSLFDHMPSDRVISDLERMRAELGPLKADNDGLFEAVDARLQLRIALLRATEAVAAEDDAATLQALWRSGLEVLPLIKATHELATPVPEALSSRLYRKLASNMPPRSVAQLTFDDAFGHMRRMFEDGLECTRVLDHVDTQSLIVSACVCACLKSMQLLSGGVTD